MKVERILENCVKSVLLGAIGVWLASCTSVAPSLPSVYSEDVTEAPMMTEPSHGKGKVSKAPTAGLRSGDTAITREPVDHSLNTADKKSQAFRGGGEMKKPSPASLRPGLATGQGRTLKSAVQFAKFTRSSSKPQGVSLIYYNDKEGVDAVAGNWKRKSKGLQKAKGGLVEWGVRKGYRYLNNYQAKGKRFVVGSKGDNYEVVLKNKCDSRLELVVSVDGLSILNAQPASFKQRGYLIESGETLIIRGFRTSQNEVAAFKFSDVSRSYTNLLGKTTRNVGVIGLAVFTEKGVSPWRWSPKIVKERLSAEAF